ncbi:hypothetical protein CspeluHIS016_0210790 [Cutaneotrichosporon spelunceum]|uniref:Uncharacterized protein n=1 Tax=Cutaneotrichosporon spelunceum TaxID=1672016 RepID=A0AAD3TSA5_9TREE|nr:hypothetical protein CspeluHIS016_0210790 [Cutaneotrichosporon spelunceum]
MDASIFVDALNVAAANEIGALQYAQAQQVDRYDARKSNRRKTDYTVVDQVLLRSSTFKPRMYQKSKSKKLAPTWFSPFTCARH